MSFCDFEMGLEITETKEYYHDVLFCAFIRTPIYKQASYCVLQINLTPIVYKLIQDDINSNKNTKFNLVLYLIDRKKDYQRIKQIFYKNYMVLSIRAEESVTLDKKRIVCRLLLVDPILYYMETTNTYNRILNNVTAYQALQDFEKFIKSTYGDTFHFNHVGCNNLVNNYIYEQILIKIKNDLNVPTHIIQTYKPFHSFNYYFFDDFNLSEKNDKNIDCIYLNLTDKNQLETFDVVEGGDILQGLKRVKNSKISDTNFQVFQDNSSINFNEYRMIYQNVKSIQSEVPKQTTVKVDQTQLDFSKTKDRTIKIPKSTSIMTAKNKNKIPQSSQFNTIYAPDNVSNAKIRFDTAKKMFEDTFEMFVQFEANNTLPDWLQFGLLYNLEVDDPTNFCYTPFSIINIFQRKIMKENYLNHIVKFNCLKFKVD